MTEQFFSYYIHFRTFFIYSYDGRSSQVSSKTVKNKKESYSSHHYFTVNGAKEPNIKNSKSKPRRVISEGGRIFLDGSGASLVIKDAMVRDQAEYRCTVHYRRSPSDTYRVQLIVNSKW